MSHMIPFNSPEDAQAFLDKQHEEHRIRMRDGVHKINELLDALNDEQLATLDNLIFASSRSKSSAAHLRGQIDVIREVKFGTCRCGTNHEEEFAAEFTTPEQPVPDDAADADHRAMLDAGAMAAYKVEPVPEDLADEYPTKFRCSECFIPIVSLEDRMLRPKGIDGCSGCQQASATGTKWYGR